MVRIIFTPKSVENQWVNRVQKESLARKVLFPSGTAPRVYNICLCQDGKPGWHSSTESISTNLDNLFRSWGVTTTINIYRFTFIDNTTEAYEQLVSCDMFYFAGVFEVQDLSLIHI